MSLLVKGGRVVDPANGFDTVADVLVADGRIAKVGKALKAPEGTEVVAATGKVVCPGLIDTYRMDDIPRGGRRGPGQVALNAIQVVELPGGIARLRNAVGVKEQHFSNPKRRKAGFVFGIIQHADGQTLGLQAGMRISRRAKQAGGMSGAGGPYLPSIG